jgi:hypothetical protein
MNKIICKPTTIDECMKALEIILTPDELKQFVAMDSGELIKYHHGLGRWIRNNWDLWKGGALLEHMKSLGFTHPDDMSMSLIKEFWARQNKLLSRMDEDIKNYAKYWEKENL